MCGARIGCIVSKKQGINGAAMKFAQARLSPPTFAQVASEAALDTPQSYFDEVSLSIEKRDTITELHKIEGAKVATQRSFYCIAELLLKMQMILQDGF
jgi:aspartate aminotransferase